MWAWNNETVELSGDGTAAVRQAAQSADRR
jgi:hypothetical protein